MPKSLVPKTPPPTTTTAAAAPTTKAPASKGNRSKRTVKADGGASIPERSHSTVFAPPTQAFTVPTFEDPGPKRGRYSFAKIPNVLGIPDLIELQKASFRWF